MKKSFQASTRSPPAISLDNANKFNTRTMIKNNKAANEPTVNDLYSSYVLVFDLCDDFSNTCGLAMAVASLLNFIYIVTWINNVTVYLSDPVETSPMRVAAYTVMTIVYSVVVWLLNQYAQGVLDQVMIMVQGQQVDVVSS
jgi:hypothetical protein